jgi:hypothetical protein
VLKVSERTGTSVGLKVRPTQLKRELDLYLNSMAARCHRDYYLTSC